MRIRGSYSPPALLNTRQPQSTTINVNCGLDHGRFRIQIGMGPGLRCAVWSAVEGARRARVCNWEKVFGWVELSWVGSGLGDWLGWRCCRLSWPWPSWLPGPPPLRSWPPRPHPSTAAPLVSSPVPAAAPSAAPSLPYACAPPSASPPCTFHGRAVCLLSEAVTPFHKINSELRFGFRQIHYIT